MNAALGDFVKEEGYAFVQDLVLADEDELGRIAKAAKMKTPERNRFLAAVKARKNPQAGGAATGPSAGAGMRSQKPDPDPAPEPEPEPAIRTQALVEAAKGGEAAEVERLLADGASPDATDERGWSLADCLNRVTLHPSTHPQHAEGGTHI